MALLRRWQKVREDLRTVNARALEAGMIGSELAGYRVSAGRSRDRLRRRGCDFRVLLAALVLCLNQRFTGVTDLREVTRFVGAVNALPGRGLPAREAEAFIRGIILERYLLGALEPDVGAGLAWPVLAAVVDDLGLSKALLGKMERKAYWYALQVESHAPELDAAWQRFVTGSDRLWQLPHDGPVGPVEVSGSPAAGVGADEGRVRRRVGSAAMAAAVSGSAWSGQPRSVPGRYLRALMRREHAQRRELEPGLAGLAPEDVEAFVQVAFEVGVRRRFEPGCDLPVISAFLQDLRDAFGVEFPMLESEALIREVLGEGDVLTGDLSMSRRSFNQQLVLVGIADMWLPDQTGVDEVLVEAEAIAKA